MGNEDRNLELGSALDKFAGLFNPYSDKWSPWMIGEIQKQLKDDHIYSHSFWFGEAGMLSQWVSAGVFLIEEVDYDNRDELVAKWRAESEVIHWLLYYYVNEEVQHVLLETMIDMIRSEGKYPDYSAGPIATTAQTAFRNFIDHWINVQNRG